MIDSICVKCKTTFGKIKFYPECPLTQAIAVINTKAKSLTQQDLIALLSRVKLKVYFTGEDCEFLEKIGAVRIRRTTDKEEIRAWVPKELEV